MKSTIRLRERILITLITLMVARLGIFIPIPNIDYNSFYNSLGQNALINFLNMFSGGGFYSIGIFALGIVPYINSSIIMQILTKIVPELENLQKEEGESGKQKITQITRYLTLLWAILQSTGISIWIKPYVFYWNESFLFDSILTLTTGSMIIMWFSEVITEYGIGNGASLIIFQNIVSGVPSSLLNYINTIHSREAIIQLSCIVLFFILILVVSILMQEGKRKVIIISARQLGKIKELNPKSYIPLKLNQGGVMPLIFASAAMALPPYLSQIVENTNLQNIFYLVSPGNLLYLPLYCCLITVFSYFYSSLILNPEDIAKNLKKMGASIPNTRPGANTIIYLEKVLNKLTLIGASFLFMLAIVPSIISYTTKVNSLKGLGVTSLLILVSVAIDTAKQIQTYIISQQYDNMMK